MGRLTEKIQRGCGIMYKAYVLDGKVVGKLGKIEDILEKYNITTLTELEHQLSKLPQNKFADPKYKAVKKSRW